MPNANTCVYMRKHTHTQYISRLVFFVRILRTEREREIHTFEKICTFLPFRCFANTREDFWIFCPAPTSKPQTGEHTAKKAAHTLLPRNTQLYTLHIYARAQHPTCVIYIHNIYTPHTRHLCLFVFCSTLRIWHARG